MVSTTEAPARGSAPTKERSEELYAIFAERLRSATQAEARRFQRRKGAYKPEPEELLGDAWLGVLAADRCWREDGGASFAAYGAARIEFALAEARRVHAQRTGNSETRMRANREARKAVSSALPLDAPLGNGRGTVGDGIEDAAAPQPAEVAEQRDIAEQALEALPPRLRSLAVWHFYYGGTLLAWGKANGVSESRAAHLLRKAKVQLSQMRYLLGGLEQE